jgi:membrane protein implicated in regulation of membrane protease activity
MSPIKKIIYSFFVTFFYPFAFFYILVRNKVNKYILLYPIISAIIAGVVAFIFYLSPTFKFYIDIIYFSVYIVISLFIVYKKASYKIIEPDSF